MVRSICSASAYETSGKTSLFCGFCVQCLGDIAGVESYPRLSRVKFRLVLSRVSSRSPGSVADRWACRVWASKILPSEEKFALNYQLFGMTPERQLHGRKQSLSPRHARMGISKDPWVRGMTCWRRKPVPVHCQLTDAAGRFAQWLTGTHRTGTPSVVIS